MKATPSVLKDQILHPEFANESLRCPACGDVWSANAGDYFMWKPDSPIKCECGEQLELVRIRRSVTIEQVYR